MSRRIALLCAALVGQALCLSTARAAQLTATWDPSINGGDGISYNDPANWDINQVPINNVSDTFVVVIPASNSVAFDVAGVGNQVDALTLGSGGVMTMGSPSLSLTVLGAADISGSLTGDNGAFAAGALTSTLTGRTKLTALNGGDVTVAAPSINFNAVVNGGETIFQATGTGSTIDLSAATSLMTTENTSFEDPAVILASDSGTIDLSNVDTATANDRMIFRVRTGGAIDLTSLQSTSRANFDVGDGSTQSANALASFNSGNVMLGTAATMNATSLVSFTNSSFDAEQNAVFNAPLLTDITGSTLTLAPNFTFTTGSISNIDNARIFVESGKGFAAVSALTYNVSTSAGSRTILEADGPGSVLSLTTLTGMVVNENSSFEDPQVVHASDNGVVDLSNVVTATSNDLLTFHVETGGDIDLTDLQTTGRVRFDVGVASYTLPALVTANSTRFDVGPSNTLNVNAMTTHDGGSVTLDNAATLNATSLATLRNTTFTATSGATYNAPGVTDLQGSTLTLSPDFTFTVGSVSNIDSARFFIEGGKSFTNVTAPSYLGAFSGSQAIMDSDGVGSSLDLSSLTSIAVTENTSFEDPLVVVAKNSGSIDLSNLVSATANDLLTFRVQTGGTLDLGSLASTDRVNFDIDIASYTLPALGTTTNSRYDVAASSTLNLPALTSHTGGSVTLADSAVLNANAVTSIQNTTLNLGQNSALNVPALTNFAGSTVTLTPDATFNAGVLSNIDGSRLLVAAGASFSGVTATTYTGTFSNAQTILEADGVGSTLDLSSLTSIQADENTSFEDVLTIRAANSGFIDLSSLDSLASNDRVRVQVQTGGDIDLDALSSVSRGGFDIDIASYDLPALSSANLTIFDIDNGATLNLPVLDAVTNSSVTVGSLGVFNAPMLTDFTGSSMTVTGDNTITTGQLGDIDNATFTVTGGGVFNTVSAPTFNSTYSSSQTIISVDGSGSELDLSSLTSFVANENTSFSDTITVVASNNGRVDLSSVTSASTNDDNVLEFKAQAGGTIDLGELVSTHNVRYQVESGGTIHSGDVQAADNTTIVITDLGSVLAFSGDLKMGPNASANVSTGGELHVAGDFSHEQTAESSVDLDAAVVRLDGTGGQLFDVAGEDLGLPGAGGGNFGIGQLVIGTTTQRTSVDLVDVIDNGNRGGGGEAEALYLYGLGGPDGLRILNNSALVLNGLNVYAWDSAMSQVVHINSLFTGGDLRIEYDDGFVQLTPLDFQWDNILGGDFNVPTNWNDNLVPLASDSALWNLGSVLGYEVVFGTNVATDSAVIKTDRVTFDLNGFTYTNAALNATTGVVVGQGPGDDAHLTVIDGTLAGASATVAADAGSVGVLEVKDGGALDVDTLTLGPGDSTVNVGANGSVALMTLDANRGDFNVLGGAALVGTGSVGAAGTYTQAADGTLAVSLDNTPLTPDSPVEVSGDAFLDGALDLTQVSVAVGDSFEVFSAGGAGGIAGTFDNAQVTGAEIDATHALAVLYEDTGDADALVDVVRLFATLKGDANGDGTVTLADLDALGSNFGAGGTWITGDFNYDGVTSLTDLDAIGATFGQSITSPAPAPGSPAVPEPASAALLALGGLALVRRR